MASWVFKLLAISLAISHTCLAYADFGTLTRLQVTPTLSIPQPHQLPSSWRHIHDAPSHPMITAAAPFLIVDDNGTHAFSWSTEYHHYSYHFKNARGLLRRQNGVFQSDASLLATCTPCASGMASGNNQTASNKCYTTAYTGILASTIPLYQGNICYGSNYAGALLPVTTSSGLPCCAVCTPRNNATVVITSGVFASSTSSDTITTTVTQTMGTTITYSLTEVSSGPMTTTVIARTSTLPQVTLSVTTIIANTTSAAVTPIVTVAAATVKGCGTASGSGTVVGSGTVFIGPGGIFPVTSSGTVSGFASKVIGCGTIIATIGSFSGTASITGCGTASGCAVLTGTGTVYPDILGGFIGITSSGVASGCGKVVGCGTLDGTGTFILATPITTTITPSPNPPRSTVNVYISYCPPDPIFPFRMARNATTEDAAQQSQSQGQHIHQPFPPLATGPLANSSSPSSSPFLNTTLVNSTMSSNSTTKNPLCQLCPQDSGICCPLYAVCGADGHCPYTALVESGYTRFGINVVGSDNSSETMGMESVAGRRAPGLPLPVTDGVKKDDNDGQKGDGNVVRKRSVLGHRHAHGAGHRQHGLKRWQRR